MARIAAGLAALLSLALVAGAGAQRGVHEGYAPKASGSLVVVTKEELEQIQHRRADAMRTEVEISMELERLPERRMIDRTGGPMNWRLWDSW